MFAVLLSLACLIQVNHRARKGRSAILKWAPAFEALEQGEPIYGVGDEGYPRYLKLDLAFELDSPETVAELEQRVPQVRDMTILLLSSKRLTELADFEGKALLKEDLRERVGGLVDGGSVESVMFTEFVVQ